MHHDAIYLIAFTSHIVAMFYGMLVVRHLEPEFQDSCPKSIFHSKTEQHFWTIILAFVVNVMSIWHLWPRWFHDRQIITNDLMYVIQHLATGGMCIMFHKITLKELKSKVSG